MKKWYQLQVGQFPLEGNFVFDMDNSYVNDDTVSKCPSEQACAMCKTAEAASASVEEKYVFYFF